MPRVHVPFLLEELSAGFTIQSRVFEGVERFVLVASDDSEVALSTGDKFSGTADLVEMSYYLTAATADIMASYLDPDGKPLFTLK